MAMNIMHAILHVFDFEANASSFSQRELDLSDRVAKSYVQRHLRKMSNSPESKHGSFLQDSAFAGELGRYLDGGCSFVDFSIQIAQFLYGELRKGAGVEACDLLVADFEADADPSSAEPSSTNPSSADPSSPAPDGLDELDPEAAAVAAALAADAYEGRGERCFAVALLPRKQAFVHDVRHEAGEASNGIVRNDATLPNPTQRLDSYAVVETRTRSVSFHDKACTIAGSETMLIPDCLLQCSSEASSKEVIEQVTRIVEDVAQEYGANAARAVSKAKAIMAEKSEESEYLPPWDLGREVFEDEPVMRERFEETAREEALPERVTVKRSVANRMAKSHRIRTDTGIEITFPSEYSTNTEFIEFVTESDGSISIELKNIGSIENR